MFWFEDVNIALMAAGDVVRGLVDREVEVFLGSFRIDVWLPLCDSFDCIDVDFVLRAKLDLFLHIIARLICSLPDNLLLYILLIS